MVFVEKPISLAFIIMALLWIIVPILLKLRGKTLVVSEEA